ncbi:MAG: hypothetical protein ACD_38C00185G0008 [uncultured bacterium]|uniref:Lmo0937 family membrane protein n=1 Tax=Candidatus Daviesbacteria bacterium GW2011_GWC2_40_12 TaxID=1618431 RepID=A0A0G0T5P7_9BACT|nr:MAG: hypothetical protein ACD_38C00185G0008 [uncultured bacterium]KKR16753.1 MAG: hypothetical protein UT45_C0004G0084 [Candidatus Daviesbacteria bacterium GW2011_GWA2_39_33]KKR42465.1 MAG: hypothetical protein UT77_C0002G0118 [Candidatus Daviesbacteria bacterium GW2011_GWC2_40_12]OGE22379.1 MAG: hypothetical protein A2778_00860 [Candidatus Daviesbacteria bacterium RIFCSPHIGHO2_01_FULL_40_24]OGE28466.1 MAG: hypothetical protein A3C29_05855 [Candidatus Daviesbacteria bacterium RIFCSPHIGHO2_02
MLNYSHIIGGDKKMGLLELLALILVIAWIAGFSFNIAGPLIHILLVLAIITFLLRFIRRQV